MPVHDWTRVDAGLFQSFRSSWISGISAALNSAILPDEYYALQAPAAVTVEEVVAVPGSVPFREPWREMTADDAMEYYRLRKSHIVIRRVRGHRAEAVIDIISAGDKAPREAVRSFAERATGLLRGGVHLLVVDLLPATPHDPQGIHGAIWNGFEGEDQDLPVERMLTVAAYHAGLPCQAYVERVGVGDTLPDMPLFLTNDLHVRVPLEATYQATWDVFPAPLKRLLEPPAP